MDHLLQRLEIDVPVENNGGQDDIFRVDYGLFMYNMNQTKERQLNVV